MEKVKKLSGRPQLKTGKRTKKIDARFTEEEYDLILKLEKELGIRKTDLVRMRVLNNAQATIINAKELIHYLDEIGAEMGRAGNNINQLAHYVNILNIKGIMSPVVAERFEILFTQYTSQQAALESTLRKVIRLMGK